MLKALLSATMFFVPTFAIMMIVWMAVDALVSLVPDSAIEAFIEEEEHHE